LNCGSISCRDALKDALSHFCLSGECNIAPSYLVFKLNASNMFCLPATAFFAAQTGLCRQLVETSKVSKDESISFRLLYFYSQKYGNRIQRQKGLR
jgi:hypothetical protein